MSRPTVDLIASDVTFALRRLRSSPGFTLFSIASIAVGIGVTTAIYAVLYSLLWRPAGIADPARFAFITRDGRLVRVAMSWPDFSDFRDQQTTFSSLAATEQVRAAVVGPGLVEPAFAEAVNGDYFTALGVPARAGRTIRPMDDAPGAPPVVVLAEDFWRRKCASDAGIIGRTIKLAGQSFEVVGIARAPFHGVHPYFETSAWIAAASAPLLAPMGPLTDASRRHLPRVWVAGRLKEGRAVATAAAEAALIGSRLDLAYPPPVGATFRHTRRIWSATTDSSTGETATISTFGTLIVGALVVVLAIACSNIANLSIARGASRAQEFAVRTALGASRWRLVREQLVESAIVGLLGGAAAFGVARFLMASFSVDIPIAQGAYVALNPEFAWPVVTMAFAALAIALLVSGAWPALQLTRTVARAALASGAAATPPRWRSHRAVLMWQVIRSVALFLVAATCLRVVAVEARHDSGVELNRLTVAHVDFSLNGRDEQQTRAIIERIVADPRRSGFESIAASAGLPFGVMSPSAALTTPDRPFLEGRDIKPEWVASVSGTPSLLRTLGIRLKAGRGFTERDTAASPPVAVLSERAASVMFPGENAVGKELLFSRTPRPSSRWPVRTLMVVGVAADTDVGMLMRRGEIVYLPLAQESAPFLATIAVTARASDPTTAVAALRTAIRRADPELAVSASGSGVTMLAGPYFLLRLIGALSLLLGVAALLLAMAGLYGVLSHAVARRTREFGVRMALGADRSSIVRLVMTDGFRPVIDGLALGLIVGLLGRLAVRSAMVQQVAAVDPIAFSLVPIPLILAAALACYLPARRAARLDPNVALREL